MISRLLVCLALMAALAQGTCHAQVLYDASLGTTPDQQQWGFASNPLAPPPFLTVTNGVLFLDTTTANSTQAGYAITPGDLNRTNGFALSFIAKLTAESHTGNTNRAGFSIIALGDDAHGIELGFWTTSIWAQADSPMFTRAENTNFPTAAAFVDYVLTLGRTSYSLFANGNAILRGPVRDYKPFSGFPDPYETPNFLFFGDDTGSAQAAWGMKRFVLVQPPALTLEPPGVITWNSASNLSFTVETSSNLVSWVKLTATTSTTDRYSITNAAPLTLRFLRVRFP